MFVYFFKIPLNQLGDDYDEFLDTESCIVPVYEGGEPIGYSISYVHKITSDGCAVVPTFFNIMKFTLTPEIEVGHASPFKIKHGYHVQLYAVCP